MERGHVHPEHGAHPRSRGEHAATLFSVGSRSGSSPLARGTQIFSKFPPPHLGLIPARAGNTFLLHSLELEPGAHPRSRGEHLEGVQVWVCGWGSSPLARGTRVRLGALLRLIGLIPARAGNTAGLIGSLVIAGAHPRSRGEHPKHFVGRESAGGSSPLARGTLILYARCDTDTGLIPARAGNTRRLLGQIRYGRAHPRSRGEHPKSAL